MKKINKFKRLIEAKAKNGFLYYLAYLGSEDAYEIHKVRISEIKDDYIYVTTLDGSGFFGQECDECISNLSDNKADILNKLYSIIGYLIVNSPWEEPRFEIYAYAKYAKDNI